MTAFRQLPVAWRRLKSLWWRIIAKPIVTMYGVEVGTNVRFYGLPLITMAEMSHIAIGDRCALCSVSSHTALGVMHPVILRTLSPSASIVIGADTGISGASICAARHITIGNRVLIGANVVIADTDFHSLAPENRRYETNPEKIGAEPVVIEDNVFIGTGTILLKGTRIGHDSVIGAGSVVTGPIPPRVIAAGNPAKILRGL